MAKYKYFYDDDAIHDYISNMMIYTMMNKLDRMNTEDRRHYTNQDRQDMQDKIDDVKRYFGM